MNLVKTCELQRNKYRLKELQTRIQGRNVSSNNGICRWVSVFNKIRYLIVFTVYESEYCTLEQIIHVFFSEHHCMNIYMGSSISLFNINMQN